MKNSERLISKTIGLIIIFTFILTACSKWIDPDLNIDPDAPADVPMNLMLPAIQQAVGFQMAGNNLVRVTNMWTQHFEGVHRQSYTQSKYQLVPAEVNNLWASIYTDIFMNTKTLIDKAEDTEGEESPHNAGIGRIIVATTLGIATDVFGDMPFKEALRGTDNIFTPSYDSQQEIYDTISSILNTAIENLNATENFISVDGDVVYNGDLTKWKKAAFSIKARHALQLSAVNGQAAYTAALTAVTNGFTSNDDDFEVPWEINNSNPIYQFMEQRTDIRMAATLVDLMKTTDDPRLPYYVAEDRNEELTGCIIGSQNGDASYPGSFVAAFDAPSIIMSYSELKFIEAEANFMLGNIVDAQADFEEAVAASIHKVTSNLNTTWLDINIKDTPVTLELILTQKYIAGFGTNQPYADYRRTGFPEIMMHPDGTLSTMPVRFPYPQDEINYNDANVPTVTANDKLWWDQ